MGALEDAKAALGDLEADFKKAWPVAQKLLPIAEKIDPELTVEVDIAEAVVYVFTHDVSFRLHGLFHKHSIGEPVNPSLVKDIQAAGVSIVPELSEAGRLARSLWKSNAVKWRELDEFERSYRSAPCNR